MVSCLGLGSGCGISSVWRLASKLSTDSEHSCSESDLSNLGSRTYKSSFKKEENYNQCVIGSCRHSYLLALTSCPLLKAKIMNEVQDIQLQQQKGAGWIPDRDDNRDKTHYVEILTDLPASVDLREWCSPIENQGKLNSCTAHAGVALVEYFERQASGKDLDLSRLFLYKATRNLLHWTGDKGANPRTTMKALALFGTLAEEYWPYDEAKVDEEPPAFCYAFASNSQALEYYRIDVQGRTREVVLQQIRANLAANRPLMFGAILYHSSVQQSVTTGMLPIPTAPDSIWGGHTMVAVGYDDNIKIKNTDPIGTETTGAILIRNSWGLEWGNKGYGWLPYEYVLRPLSNDWWTLLKVEWLDTGKFNAKE